MRLSGGANEEALESAGSSPARRDLSETRSIYRGKEKHGRKQTGTARSPTSGYGTGACWGFQARWDP